jgi:Fic family protein
MPNDMRGIGNHEKQKTTVYDTQQNSCHIKNTLNVMIHRKMEYMEKFCEFLRSHTDKSVVKAAIK